MMSLRNKRSLIEAEVMCLEVGGEAVLPQLVCTTFSAFKAQDLGGIDPVLLKQARKMGIQLPVETLVA